VLVIGGGYTGLSAARRLALSGASALVVDRGFIGWGASSRNGGQVLTGLKVDPATLVARFGERRAGELFEAANVAIATLENLIESEGIECDYRRSGHAQAAWKRSHFSQLLDEQALLARVFDYRVDIVGPSEQRSEVGSAFYHGLLVDERSGCLNPARYVSGLADAAVRAGARVCGGVGIARVEGAAGAWLAHTDKGAAIRAKEMLVATNGYTDGAAPEVRRRLLPIGSYIIATEPLDPARACALLPKRRVVFDSKYFLFYFRVTSDGRLLFGGRAEFRRPDDRAAGRAARILYGGMIAVFPELRGTKVEYAWGGNVAFTRDRMPHAGRLNGMYFAGGYCGHGVALATAFGDLMARRMAGERVDNPLLELECPPIPLYRGTPWFLPLVGAYYKVQDWIS
jgi:glycine/D-amino acid oxidase-like deaminating enzyme